MARSKKKAEFSGSPFKNRKEIANHKKAALYFEAAAKDHKDVAKYLDEGDGEQAFRSSILAAEKERLAFECLADNICFHTFCN